MKKYALYFEKSTMKETLKFSDEVEWVLREDLV